MKNFNGLFSFNIRTILVLPLVFFWSFNTAATNTARCFASVPESLIEAAKLDGASDFTCLFRIIIPLSKATVAVVLLFYGTGSVQGFATTLLLGVITSMITAIVVTRFLLTRFVRVFHEPRLFVAVKPAADAAVEGEAK